MINKKSLWFLTLFSLILVLSVYYVTMPNELLLTNNSNYKEEKKKSEESKKEEETTVKVDESDILVALRVEANEQIMNDMDDLKLILTSVDSTLEEKNNAFEKMQALNITRGEEEKIEKQILTEFKLKAFVKIDGDQIRVVVAADALDASVANNIMRSVQKNYEKKMYISVKFQK